MMLIYVTLFLWLEENKYNNYSYWSLEVNLSKIADWDITDFPALPLLGNFCYETVVFQIQIEGHLHLWVQLLTLGYCHYTSFIFNTNGYNLSKLITIFCQMLISSKFVYTYIYVCLFTILHLLCHQDLGPFLSLHFSM